MISFQQGGRERKEKGRSELTRSWENGGVKVVVGETSGGRRREKKRKERRTVGERKREKRRE